MAVDETRSFSALLSDILNHERVSVPLLFRLSDLPADEMAEFKRRWLEADEERRRMVIRHLADISEENFQVDFTAIFAYCLDDPSPPVRLASLDGLWDTEEPSLIDPVVGLMESDENTEVRALAAANLGHFVMLGALGRLNEQTAAQVTGRLLEQYDSAAAPEPVRLAALESLGAAAHPRVRRLIEEAYDSGDLARQLSAVFAMGSSADERWLPTVIDELSSPLAEMRLEAARAAGALGRSEAVPPLEELTADEDLEVRLSAVQALGQIGGDLATEILARLSEDTDAEDLHEAVDEAVEEMDWLGGELDFSFPDWNDDSEE